MPLNRRQFLNLAAGSVATGLLGTGRFCSNRDQSSNQSHRVRRLYHL